MSSRLILSRLLIATALLSSLAQDGLAATLDGEWAQPCRNRVQKREYFDQDRSSLHETSFVDPACTLPRITLITSGRIELGAAAEIPADATKIDFTFGKLELLPHTEEIARYLDSEKMCGLTSWRAGEAREITGMLCELFFKGLPVRVPSPGQRRFGIYKIETGDTGERLFFGKLTPEENASSDARRPRSWNPEPFTRALESFF